MFCDSYPTLLNSTPHQTRRAHPPHHLSGTTSAEGVVADTSTEHTSTPGHRPGASASPDDDAAREGGFGNHRDPERAGVAADFGVAPPLDDGWGGVVASLLAALRSGDSRLLLRCGLIP